VDRQKIVTSSVVEAVARDFDLGDTSVSAGVAVASASAETQPSEKLDLVSALKTLVSLADRLRESEQDPKEGKL